MHRARSIEQQNLYRAKAVGIDSRCQYRRRGPQPQRAPFRERSTPQAGHQCLGAIRRQHHPAQEEAAVAIGPNQEQRWKQPQPPARFQNHNGQREEQISEELRPVEREWNRDGSRGEAGHRRAVQHARTPPRHQAGETAERCQQQRAQPHHTGKTGGAISGVEERLCQPLVSQVEVPHRTFARIRQRRRGGGIGERIGYRQRARLHDVLAGTQMPPEIGIANLRR